MVFGWRKAFCTSVPSNQEKPQQSSSSSSHIPPPLPTPRFRSKFGFFSNPSTPRLRSRGGGGGIGCRSAASTAVTNPSLPTSPKLHCKTTSNATPRTSNSSTPKFFSNPSSPKSSSSSSSSHGGVSLLRATLLLNKSNSSRCGICLQRVNSGQFNSTAVFTAECSHLFHLSCAVKLQDKRCPFCSAAWSQTPKADPNSSAVINNAGPDPNRRTELREIKTGKSLRVYNDDEPLAYSPVSLAQINTIPESDENDDVEEDDGDEFPGFFADSAVAPPLIDPSPSISGNLEVKLQPETAVVESGKRSETHVVVMKLKASPSPSDAIKSRRPSIDLVTVLDLSGGGANLQTVKQFMRLVISLLREMDRLSIVVFSTGSKRLMPLRRMTAKGRRSTQRIIDALVGIETNGGVGMSVNDALKKAVKVVEDRREKNPTASILVLSDGQDQPEAVLKAKLNSPRVPFVVSTTRFSRSEIPIHSVWIASPGALHHAPLRNAFTERIASLLNVAIHGVRLDLGLVSGSSLTEISSVYSLTGRTEIFGSGLTVLVGDLFAEEEREFLVELKVPTSSSGAHHVMSIRSSIVDPTTHQPISCPKDKRFLIPRPHAVRFISPSIERVRNLHSVCRAVADSRKLIIEREDLSGAFQLLTVARSAASHADDSLKILEAELTELNRFKPRNGIVNQTEEKTEQLTPTSAWRAAEKLAKVAIMRKHLNRVSDMHGLENARF